MCIECIVIYLYRVYWISAVMCCVQVCLKGLLVHKCVFSCHCHSILTQNCLVMSPEGRHIDRHTVVMSCMCCLLACCSPSSSTMTFVLLGVLLMWTWGMTLQMAAQAKLGSTYLAALVGWVDCACTAGISILSYLIWCHIVCCQAAGTGTFHLSRLVESCSSSTVEILHLWSMYRNLWPPGNRCSLTNSP